MKNIKKYLGIGLSAAMMWSCTYDEPEIATPQSGEADFSNYVAIGNSLSAGFADNALFQEGQESSFPSIIARQMTLTGQIGEFNYPEITQGENGTGRSFIDIQVALAAIAGVPGASVGDAIQATTPMPLTMSSKPTTEINNFGVPGARIIDAVTPGYGLANPFFGNFQSSASASMVSDAVAAQPTFFTSWLGNNDVLGYATSGGAAGEGFTGTPGELTSVAAFSQALTAELEALNGTGAKGVVLNIPPVTIIPFFQIVTELGGGHELIPLDGPTASQVNAGYDAEYNPGLQAAVALQIITPEEASRRTIAFEAGNNAPVITDESLTEADISAAFSAPPGTVVLPKLRQGEPGDRYPLTALAVIGQQADPNDPTKVYGVSVPVPDESTLTTSEQGAIITRYATFNQIIENTVANYDNMVLLDVGPVFADIFGLSSQQAAGLGLSSAAQAAADGALGLDYNGTKLVPLSLTQEELFSSIWSTDGVHPNARGSAIIANEIIKKINAEFNASIPLENVFDYNGINAK